MSGKNVTLREYMASYPQGLGISEATALLLPVAIDLRNRHNDGAFHLQVSPDTILVSAGSRVLAEPTGRESDCHCAGFAAPEIYKGVSYGVLSDVYSFAAVLMYAATGMLPANSLQRELLEAEFAMLEKQSPVFATLIRTAMAEDAGQRIPNMQEMIYRTAFFYEQRREQPLQAVPMQAAAPAEEPLQEVPPQKRVRKGIPVVAAAVFCAVVAVLLWYGYSRLPAQPQMAVDPREERYIAAAALMEQGQYDQALEAFAPLEGYRDSDVQMENCRMEIGNAALEERYQQAETLEAEGKFAQAGIAFGKLGDFKDARNHSLENWDKTRTRQTIAVGTNSMSYPFYIGIKNDGTAILAGGDDKYCKSVSHWQDLVEVDMIRSFPIGLKADGTILLGEDFYSDIYDWEPLEEAQRWTNLARLYTDTSYGVSIWGLKRDGTVVYTGKDYYTQAIISEWTDIVELYGVGYGNVLGLRSDGTIVGIGIPEEIKQWDNVVSITQWSSGWWGYYKYITALCADGTVWTYVTVLGETELVYCGKADGWTDMVSAWGPVGVHKDGTVSVFPEDARCRDQGYADTSKPWKDLVGDWSGITAICGQSNMMLGLKEDGTVVTVGTNWNGYANWTDMAFVFTDGWNTFGIKSDGSAVTDRYDSKVNTWTDIRIP